MTTSVDHAPEHAGHIRSGETLVAGALERRAVERLEPDVARCSLTVRVPRAGEEVVVSDVPTLRLTLPSGTWTADWFSSSWGDEFYPQQQVIDGEPWHLEVRAGRSSKTAHPWLCLSSPEHGAVVVSPAWSGNWAMDVAPAADGSLAVSAGINPWKFFRTVDAQTPFVAPEVYVAWGADRFAAGAALATAVGRWVAPTSALSHTQPVEWNHWWPYEDAEIDHETFVRNAEIAARLGFDLATCDAGWFGRPDAATFWERERGDWDEENTERFPSGLTGLADDVRAAGLPFGIWIEAEAVGIDAALNSVRPDIIARRDDDPPPLLEPTELTAWQAARERLIPPQEMPDPGNPAWLGYVCLGSPAGREHVRQVLHRLIARTGCRWVKWDFNLDPGAGCSRTDHGHGAGDGLYEHYRGLYALLDEFRGAYPGVIWEACASGGLRLDLGLAARFHSAFLSDPDWTEFHLQLMWAASQMLPAASIHHFSESQWRGHHGSQHLDPATLDAAGLDCTMHAVTLHSFGVSLALPELSPELQDRLAGHLTTHHEHMAPLIAAGGVIRPLTAQPMRDGGGERFPAFQLAVPPTAVAARAAGTEAAAGAAGAAGTVTCAGTTAIAVVRLDGAPDQVVVRPVWLDPVAVYAVEALEPGEDPGCTTPGRSGASLMADGLRIDACGAARSWLLLLTPVAVEPAAAPSSPAAPGTPAAPVTPGGLA